MFATRTLTAFAALTLTASVASAQLPAPKKVNLPKANAATAINPNLQQVNPPALSQTGALQLPAGLKERLSAPDLAVTKIQVVAGNKVQVTVANVGRSATPRSVTLKVASSGTGNLDSPAAQTNLTVPVLAVNEEKVFTTSDDRLVREAKAERASGQPVILLAANVDFLGQVTEAKEANNVLIVTTK